METKSAAEGFEVTKVLISSVIIWKRCVKMWPGNQPDSYTPTSFFGSFCNTISSCLSFLCCCWLFKGCLGRRREPTTPLIGPPSGPMDDHLGHLGGPHSQYGESKPPGPPGPISDRLGDLGGPHSPFGVSNPPRPPGPIDDHLRHLGGPHNPFGVSNPHGPPGPKDDRLGHLGGSHSSFGVSNAPGPPGPMDDHLGHLGGPHSPFGQSDPPGPPGQSRPPIRHGNLEHPEPPHPHGSPGLPEPPRVPSVQPGLL